MHLEIDFIVHISIMKYVEAMCCSDVLKLCVEAMC